MKKIFFTTFLFFFFLAFYFFPTNASAQGTDCTSGIPAGRCVEETIGCNPNENSRASAECAEANGEYGVYNFYCCFPKPNASPPGSCSSFKGTCSNACGGNNTETKGQLDCPSSNPVCCAPKAGTPSGGDNIRCTPTGGKSNEGIYTAIGCIPFGDLTAFGSFFLKWAVGIGGGIAFLLIVYAGFMILTSSGNPDKIKAGQELMTSAIGGLLLLIFSVFILRLIGVDILKLPI